MIPLDEILPSRKIERIIIKKNVAHVFMKSDTDVIPSCLPVPKIGKAYFHFYFNIISPKTFEKNLKKIYRELNISRYEEIIIEYEDADNDLVLDSLEKIFPYLFLSLLSYFTLSSKSDPFQKSSFQNRILKNSPKKEEKITFGDVAGLEEAKQEIQEFIDILQNPKKYKEIGAKIPRGAILIGPPGTGKTLLAKAAAGEAKVPFFSISGSEFVEIYVGIGPARVRKLFETARKNTPCIIFIDEIDAVGQKRQGTTDQSRHHERESTLNQLLVELDGFSRENNMVVLAGTNRPDILDPALLRPGRFDRRIKIDLPHKVAREQIFQLHLRDLKLESSAQEIAQTMAKITTGFSGADISNVCNEAAMIASRENLPRITQKNFEQAFDRITGGIQNKTKVLTKREKEVVSVHEAGHIVTSWFLENPPTCFKASIIPHATSLGFTQFVPQDTNFKTSQELFDRICVDLGGRVAEKIKYKHLSTSAKDDLMLATELAYQIATEYGMNKKIGSVSLFTRDPITGAVSSPRKTSEYTRKLIDTEVRQLIAKAEMKVELLLHEKAQEIDKVSAELASKEVLHLQDFERLLGKPSKKITDSNPIETLSFYYKRGSIINKFETTRVNFKKSIIDLQQNNIQNEVIVQDKFSPNLFSNPFTYFFLLKQFFPNIHKINWIKKLLK
ncbi:atp-dependent protease [Anaeramoeba ignava]|uniref:Atp-dependent protease n=1 Tax=Anaeramoeba ignava TaxID=1746090 RepID=A0A9Q0LSR2_ANAIG|nr:atp-dependent protease [Anaeramoeba ignava]